MEDVINCQLINVGGRMYRYHGNARLQAAKPTVQYDKMDESQMACEPEEIQLDMSGIEQHGNQYVAKLYLDPEVRTLRTSTSTTSITASSVLHTALGLQSW